MYSRFTDRARKVMQFANDEAIRFQHEYVGTEHILLGLIFEGSGVAGTVLKNFALDLQTIRREVEKIVMPGPETDIQGQLPMTPRAKKVIEGAIDEARALNHQHVGTEHLLLGLLRELEGVAAQVLMNLGLTLPRVRQEVLSVLGHTQGPGGPPFPPEMPVDLNPDLTRLPEPARNIVLEFDRQIELLQQEKAEVVGNQEWEKALRLCEMQCKLHKLKFDFTRNWLE